MAGSYIRGSKGRFAGSTRGWGARGGGGGGGKGVAVRRADRLTKSGSLAPGTPIRNGAVLRSPGGTSARYYRTTRRNGGGGALVGRIGPGGRLTATKHRNALPVGFTRRTRIGSPIGGNSRLRYVSRTNAATRATGWLSPGARAVGRYTSRRGARQINTGRMPRSGYVVAYGPRLAIGR